MKRFKKILVAIDTRFDDHPIVEQAAEIALHNQASLKIIDVVPEFSWTTRLTLPDHEHMRELIKQEKEQKLAELAAPIRERGVKVDTAALLGKSSVEIVREVLHNQHDLVLRVAKGKESRRRGFFGATALHLLRKCPCALWLVSPDTTPKFKHVMACVDTSAGNEVDDELNNKVYELAASISHYHEGKFSVVHAWSIWNEQMLRGHLRPEEFEAMEKHNHHQVETLLNTFLEKHGSNVKAGNVHLIKEEPFRAIPEFARNSQVDLVVMGTVARSGLSGLTMGNTAEQILNDLQCSVLAIKPEGFVSPISE